MVIDIITIFPNMFQSVFAESIVKRAQERHLISIKIHNLRDWTHDRHKTVDDKPFGGGPGMVMKPEPIFEALDDILKLKIQSSKSKNVKAKTKVILLTPQGKKLDQRIIKSLSKHKRLVLICGHYEGVDERVRKLADEEISIGDYILTCGEIPAMALLDAVARLIPGVLGDERSSATESFENNLLEYPQYTRPADYRGMKAPEILLSGDHRAIEEWRRKKAIERTKKRRPELLEGKTA